jgi:hypothetical protein
MSTEYSAKTILLAVVPKFPALLSMLGSIFIVLDVSRSPKKRKRMKNRIMLGLSCSDILASSVYFIGTWFIPRGTIGQYGPIFLASGNTATCTTSGFFTQLAICSPLYNGSLCMCYLLSTKYSWSDRALQKIEPILHAVPICFAIGTATAGAALNLYGSVEWLCWVNPVIPAPDTTWIYQWTFLFIPLWIVVLFVSFVMFSLWWTMYQQEQKMARRYRIQIPEANKDPDNSTQTSVHAIPLADELSAALVDGSSAAALADGSSATPRLADGSSGAPPARRTRAARRTSVINDNGNKISKPIAVQGMMYIAAFYITWFFPSVQRIIEVSAEKNFFVLQFFDTALLPFQGYLNVAIFVRPRYLRVRKANPEFGFFGSVWAIIHNSLYNHPEGMMTTTGGRHNNTSYSAGLVPPSTGIVSEMSSEAPTSRPT